MTWQDDLRAKAVIWRSRPPSGKCIMHHLPRDRWCERCGEPVTKWHEHGTKKNEFVVAKSAWMGKVPTGPAKGRAG